MWKIVAWREGRGEGPGLRLCVPRQRVGGWNLREGGRGLEQWLAEIRETRGSAALLECREALPQLPGGFPVHQPIQFAAFGVNQLGGETPGVPGFLYYFPERPGLGRARHQKGHDRGLIDKGRGESDPVQTLGGDVHGRGPALLFLQGAVIRKKGGGVTVFAQAQEDQVQAGRSPGAELPEQGFILPGSGSR